MTAGAVGVWLLVVFVIGYTAGRIDGFRRGLDRGYDMAADECEACAARVLQRRRRPRRGSTTLRRQWARRGRR